MAFGVNPWLGLVIGVILAVALSQVIGYPCFRLRGHYFAIATIAIGEIIHTLAINWEFIGGARGSRPIRQDSLAPSSSTAPSTLHYIILALMALFLVTWRIERPGWGTTPASAKTPRSAERGDLTIQISPWRSRPTSWRRRDLTPSTSYRSRQRVPALAVHPGLF
jgi:branched-chain amino acid transport system permease protein